MTITRTFEDIQDDKFSEAEWAFRSGAGLLQSTGWKELLQSERALLVAEAGTGKTYECRTEQQRLWNEGKPAFFLELATLAKSNLPDMLDAEEESRLTTWVASQSDIAYFFLDSIDELNLSRGSFEQALKRLRKAIDGKLGRSRIVITTRPIPLAKDKQIARQQLPVPPPPSADADGDSFAQVAMRGYRGSQNTDARDDWRTVSLEPLSDTQIMEFAKGQGVADASALLNDVKQRNAMEFAQRPQDLIELCADWRDSKQIRAHREQVDSDIRLKLKPREDRDEPAELSVEKAEEGASRLALAMAVTRRPTIRHSAEDDVVGEDATLDPGVFLPDWPANERKALLERPLFGPASYGRVRFHHRSVMERLGALRVCHLYNKGVMSTRKIKRLIFAEGRDNKPIVRPSMRPIAGWLALEHDFIFETLRDNEPAVLFDYGDPESLTDSQRKETLGAFVGRYGRGDWRGIQVPEIQVQRIASPKLAGEINRLWASSVKNPEVREILLRIIAAAKIDGCSDIAHAHAVDANAPDRERFLALDALATLDDARLGGIVADIAGGKELWPDELANAAVPRLFPRHITARQLRDVLARAKGKKGVIGDLTWQLPRLIKDSELSSSYLKELRDDLSGLVLNGLGWSKERHQFISDYAYLCDGLAVACARGIGCGVTEDWLRAGVIAVLPDDGGYEHHHDSEFRATLMESLANLPERENAALFWVADSVTQTIREAAEPYDRFENITSHGGVRLDSTRDLGWIKAALSDTDRTLADRALLLETATRIMPDQESWRDYVGELKSLVSDAPDLVSTADECLNQIELREASKPDTVAKFAAREKRQKDEENAALRSWEEFQREIEERPDEAFSPEHGLNTILNLCYVAGGRERHVWNRLFIEQYFGAKTADRARDVLMDFWRKHTPAPADSPYVVEKDLLGLAAIYAEAEDPNWAANLTEQGAQLAARYAMRELNSLPAWLENLVNAHPKAVDATLGEELTRDLEAERDSGWHSMLLQNIGHASKQTASAFVPRLRAWLDANHDSIAAHENRKGASQRLHQVIDVLLEHGDEDALSRLRAVAQGQLEGGTPDEFAFLWLPALMTIDVDAGVVALEKRIQGIEPAQYGDGVKWFAVLFGDPYRSKSKAKLSDPRFTPRVLLRLLRLTYRHVRPDDDLEHEGSFSPDTRDDAEYARGQLVGALLDAHGEEGWAVKFEMAEDPLFAHFKDRIVAAAEESWAQEVDAAALTDEQAIDLDKGGEFAVTTNEAMFTIMVDRIEEIDELLQGDASPRETWALISTEKLMRREIARQLKNDARGLYTVEQETVTGEEKETDIRLISTASAEHVAVIELKLAEKWSARDLCDALSEQLVKKYMRPKSRRSGCLMVTRSKKEWWKNPNNGSRLDFDGLAALLRQEADKIAEECGGPGAIRLHVHPLDLRPTT